MTEAEFQRRTTRLALRSLKVVEALPKSVAGRTVAAQLTASATSVVANYRSACRAGSPVAFRHRLGLAEEECDETVFWIEFAAEAELIDAPRTHELLREAGEILAMLVASRRTSSRRTAQSKIENPQSKIP